MNDLIRRQAAIDTIIAEGRTVDSRYLESKRVINESDAVEALSMLPSVQPVPRWIPVTERLPEKYVSPEKYVGEWLCCTDDGTIMILLYGTLENESKESVFYLWDEYGHYYETYNVVAWMPLPKPYERSEDVD